LPDSYRSFLLSYPELLCRTPAAANEILNSATELSCINTLLAQANVDGWETSFFAIGQSGCGDYYAIDLDEEDGEVYFWNHETAAVDVSEGKPSLEEFAGSILQMYKRLDALIQPKWKFWMRKA